MLGFAEPIRAVVLGARGGLGGAFARRLVQSNEAHQVWGTARDAERWGADCTRTSVVDVTDEDSLLSLVAELNQSNYQPNLVLNCTGLLHDAALGPEKTWRHLEMDVMRRVFEVNTFGVALLGKHLLPLLPRRGRSVFASISARVGSIQDNRLGGWYSYRASKAAQNMMIKTLAIEASRRWPELTCVVLHPGTVKTALSQPFQARVPPEKLFSAEQSCAYLCEVISNLDVSHTGHFYAWDGQQIPF